MKKYFIFLFISFFHISTTWSLPAPKYLSVYHWKYCVHTTQNGTAYFVCLPLKKPIACPSASWQKLTQNHLIGNCPIL